MLKVDQLTVEFSSKKVLDAVTLEFEVGKIYGLIGHNGAGKTTFFNAILNNIPYSGTVTFDSSAVDITQLCWIETNIAFYDYLYPNEWYKMAQNMLNIAIESKPLVFEIDTTALIKDLSTGNKKKAYMNGIFQKDFNVYLLDEPFNALDISSVAQLKKYIRQISTDAIVIISSNVIEQLMAFCDDMLLIENQQVAKISQTELENFI